MRFSLNFIKEFLEVKISPQKLADKLTMAGMEVENLEKKGADHILDIEVTSNRYDWLSMVGIAREIAAILGKELKVQYPAIKKMPALKEKDIIIADPRDCPYYIGRMIRNVRVGQTPKEIKDKILNCGLSSINDVVDVTNYCMLKWGNPLHAFDSDKIEGDVYIRRAKDKEKFIGIDEKERILNQDNLVIADKKKVIALAGVMGAKNTEVDEATRNVFLEAAVFSPLTVRRSRRRAGLDTESSYRFERKVDPRHLEYASYQAGLLIEQLAKGDHCAVKAAGKSPPQTRKKITVNFAHLDNYLGLKFPPAAARKILKNLDFEIKPAAAGSLTVLAPARRFDLQREVDVYEELARIYGYDKIAARIPFLTAHPRSDPLTRGKEDTYRSKNKLSAFMALLGFQEIITYSIEGEKERTATAQEEGIVILNPLRQQERFLRTSLLPGMIKSVAYNLNRNQVALKFFELADVYLKDNKGFLEIPVLALGASGQLKNFFYLKKALEEMLTYSNITSFSFREAPVANFTNALKVFINNQEAGFLGKLDEKVSREFDLKEALFFGQLNLNLLLKKRQALRFHALSPYPVIFRDISLSLNKSVRFKTVESLIRGKSKYLIGLRVTDTYEGKGILPETKAFTLRIFYQAREKTLTAQEVDAFHSALREELDRLNGVSLR